MELLQYSKDVSDDGSSHCTSGVVMQWCNHLILQPELSSGHDSFPGGRAPYHLSIMARACRINLGFSTSTIPALG